MIDNFPHPPANKEKAVAARNNTVSISVTNEHFKYKIDLSLILHGIMQAEKGCSNEYNKPVHCKLNKK